MEEETQRDEVNESHPNEGEIEEAVKDTGLGESPEEAADDESDDADQT